MTLRSRKNVERLARLLAVGFGLFLFVALELVARWVTDESELDQILDILEQDPVLFWRQRSGLDTIFAEHAVVTDERGFRVAEKDAREDGDPSEALRIVCLGASPTFGWGVDASETYSQVLQHRLSASLKRPVQVTNGGMIGYSSHQGRLLFEREIAPQHPDIITVSYVINDVDSYRFFRSDGRPDRSLEPAGLVGVTLQNLLMRSLLVRLLNRLSVTLAGGTDTVDGKPMELYRPQSVRVSPRHYEENVKAIIESAKAQGIRVWLIKMPVHLPAGIVPDAKTLEKANDHLEKGVRLSEENRWEDALPELEKALELAPDLALAHYTMARCCRKLGRDDEAREAIRKTMASESKRCGRMGLQYNAIMERIAHTTGTPLVDVPAAFEKETRYLFVSPETDPIHPNALGHRIIGEHLAERISRGFAVQGKP